MSFLKQRSRLVIFVAMCLLLGSQIALADSLWTDSSNNMFSDRRAHTVGDTVTILISESSTAAHTGNASNSKSGSDSLSAGSGIFHFLAAASAGSSDSFSAKGALSNTNSVSGKLTVQITEVKPNGNLAISGTQSINQSGEEQKITITGTIRQDDISPDNTVASSNVADAKLKIDGNGPIANKQREGILTQLFNFVF